MKFKRLDNKIFNIDIIGTDLVIDVKRKLSKKVKIYYENIGLILKNKFLFNEKLITDYKVACDEIVLFFENENLWQYSMKKFDNNSMMIFNVFNTGVEMTTLMAERVFINNSYSIIVPNEYNEQIIYNVNVKPSDSIFDMKLKLKSTNNIDTINGETEWLGKILDDDKSLEYYEIDKKYPIVVRFTEVIISNYRKQTFRVRLCPNLSIGELKRLICAEFRCRNLEDFDLYFTGQYLLDNEKTLIDYRINNGDTIIFQESYKLKQQQETSELSENFPAVVMLTSITNDYETFSLTNLHSIDEIFDALIERFNIPRSFIYLFTDRAGTAPINNNEDICGVLEDSSSISIYYLIFYKFSQYEISSELGKGSFGKVYKCKKRKDNKIFAMKKIKLSYNGMKNQLLMKQLDDLISLDIHSGIIQYMKQYNTRDTVFILMEFMDSGSIGSHIKQNGALSENKIFKYCKQILGGLEYLHMKKIVHRNIKSGNILIDKHDEAKLCDYGLIDFLLGISSEDFSNDLINAEFGTINWASPEILKGETIEPPADIWSFGATVIEMITGRVPHHGLSFGEMILSILAGEIKFEYPPSSSNFIRSFVSVCIERYSKKRATISELFNHQFLR